MRVVSAMHCSLFGMMTRRASGGIASSTRKARSARARPVTRTYSAPCSRAKESSSTPTVESICKGFRGGRGRRSNRGSRMTEKRRERPFSMKTKKRGRVTSVDLNEVVEARHQSGLSQAQFAQVLGISKRTLQEWEQGRRSPSGAAQALIRIAKRYPDVVQRMDGGGRSLRLTRSPRSGQRDD